MIKTDEAVTRWTIKMLVDQHDHDLWCIICPELPLFHAVGETEEAARENVRTLLKQFLERNYSVEVHNIEFADEVGTLEQPLLPAYMIAEVARIGGQAIRT